MVRKSRENPEIREFILRNIELHPEAIGPLTAEKFSISRTAVSGYMRRLLTEGLISAEGRTNARRYALKPIASNVKLTPVTAETSENDLWREHFLPHLKPIPANVLDICQYGVTEMINNVVDHSQSETVLTALDQKYTGVDLRVTDYGIGIFEKIKRDFNLEDARSALLELSKGKLTSDRTRHTGEGVFFTSRMFDRFSILSGNLYYQKTRTDDWGWLIDIDDVVEYTQGTIVQMVVSTDADWRMKDVFEKFQDDDLRFAKTHVPISLGKYPGEQLVSRSQAKRILAHIDKFSEVFLDFRGVEIIGQAFADEIFRVFQTEHPGITIRAINKSDEVEKMIKHVTVGEPLSSSDVEALPLFSVRKASP